MTWIVLKALLNPDQPTNQPLLRVASLFTPFEQGLKTGFSLDTSMHSALETSWQCAIYIYIYHYHYHSDKTHSTQSQTAKQKITLRNMVINILLLLLLAVIDFLADRCNATFGYWHNMSSVSLWRECIVTKRLQLGSCNFHWNAAQCLNSLPKKFNDKIRRGPLDLGAQKWGGVVFDFAMSYLGNGAR